MRSGAGRVRRAAGSPPPVGAYLALPCALVFCAWPSLWGARCGAPDGADLRRIVPVLELAGGAAPHASLIDACRLESGDPRRAADRDRVRRRLRVAAALLDAVPPR
jgi:hypothetical protein